VQRLLPAISGRILPWRAVVGMRRDSDIRAADYQLAIVAQAGH